MSTLHLVDPSARDVVASFPPLDGSVMGIETLRATVLSLYPADRVAKDVRLVPGPKGAADVRVLLYRPERSQKQGPLPAILYLHGGGFVGGDADMMDTASLKLANDMGAMVVAVDFRLAPEAPFPGPVEDCYAALVWLAREAGALGVDSARIAILGQSGGGGLAAALALLARDRGGPTVKAQILTYPMLDPRTGTAEAPVDNLTTGEFAWTASCNRFGWGALRGSAPIPEERIGHFAPALAADVSNLPPTFIAVGALDLFLEEDVAYALRLSRAGVPVEAHVYPGGVHGFDAFPGALADGFAADLKAAIGRML